MQRQPFTQLIRVGNAVSSLLLFLFLLMGRNFDVAEGKHIAFFTPTGSYSHRVSMWPLVTKLVENGHHVTFISSYPPKDPLENVTEIVPTEMAKYCNDYMQGGDLDVTNRISGHLDPGYIIGPQLGIISCEKFLEDPVTQRWLKTEPQIDLFVVDWFASECILGLAYKLKAPFIFYSPTVMVSILYEEFGVLMDSAGIPDYDHHHSPPMNFWQRLDNALQPLFFKYKYIAYYNSMTTLLREKFNIPDMPPLGDIVRNASLLMWSESVIEGYAHQLPPNWITVGGMHCKENSDPLPQKLEKIVQQGKDGFIYFSFGSAVVPANLPQGHRDAFFNAIRAFPNIQFLWKWTGEMPKEDIPPNLYIDKWFPQQDLLAHKKILAFVTQAGRPSTQEAIFHGVPIIAMPVFEDQDYTAEKIRDMGGGIALEIATITQQEFQGAIREITTNPKYKETMERLSKLFKDRPMKPADTAVWWTEYVLRHNGNLNHFKTPSYNLTWYERRSIDVWGFLLIVGLLAITASLVLVIFIIKLVWKALVASNSDIKKKNKNGQLKRKNK